MTELSQKSVVPFTGQRTYAISPMIAFDAPDKGRNSRYAVMERLLRLFEQGEVILPYDDNEHIKIIQVYDDFVVNDDYWGGDAVLITVPSKFTGEDVSKSLGSDIFCVYDQGTRNYFVDGKSMVPAFKKADGDATPSPA